MKKLSKLLIVLVLVVCVSACGTKSADENKNVVEDETIVSLLNNHMINLTSIPKTATLLKDGSFDASKYANDDKLYMGLTAALNSQLAAPYNTQQIQALKAKGITATSAIKTSDVEDIVANLFGPSTINFVGDVTGCPSFKYNEAEKIYYVNESCTKAQDNIVMLVDSITNDGNVYEVKAYLGLVSENKVYKDFAKSNSVKELANGETYTINGDNKDEFSTYTFTFTKNSDGNYIFKDAKRN